MRHFLISSILPLLIYALSLRDAYGEKERSRQFPRSDLKEVRIPRFLKRVLFPFGAGKRVSLMMLVKIVIDLLCVISFLAVNAWFGFFTPVEDAVQMRFYQIFIPTVFSAWLLGLFVSFCIGSIDNMKREGIRVFGFCVFLIALLISALLAITLCFGIVLLCRITAS